MGQQRIKQPNGKYCLFSSIVDNFTHYDMSEKEIVELWANKEKENHVPDQYFLPKPRKESLFHSN